MTHIPFDDVYGPPPSSRFDDWIEIAAGGLHEPVRRRVTEEVAEHYNAAYADAVRRGLRDDDAEDAAVRALGNPWFAWLRFCRHHLTAREWDYARRAGKPVGKKKLLLWTAVMTWPFWLVPPIVLAAALFGEPDTTKWFSGLVTTTVFVAVVLGITWLFWKFYRTADVARRLLIRGVGGGVAVVIVAVPYVERVMGIDPQNVFSLVAAFAIACGLCFWLVVVCLYPLYVRHKLVRTGHANSIGPAQGV